MDCKKTQQLFDDLWHQRLTPETAAQVGQHLADCTDCRVLQQRAARLQRLLALKRYERPVPAYFDNFLSEFHRRLLAEAQRTGWWEQVLGRVDDLLAVESMRVWRYRFASAMGVAVVMGVVWMGVRQTSDPGGAAGQTASANASWVVAETEAMLPPPHSTPSTIAAPIPSLWHATPADYQPATAGSVDTVPAPTHADSTAPRYVLDRISVTPATYDVPSVHF
jgi:hypothetical protein